MPYYRKHGKIQSPLSDDEWLDLMKKGRFVKRKHIGFVALLYYFAIRRGEALKTLRNQLVVRGGKIYYDVGERFKNSKTTPALPIPIEAPFVDEIIWSRNHTNDYERVWPYCEKTAYNIVNRVLPAYPHYFRLSRITNFFKEGWTIAQVRSWTGLSLRALDYYVGLVDIERMGENIS